MRLLLPFVLGVAACSNGASNGQDVLAPPPDGTGTPSEEPVAEEPKPSFDLELPQAGTLPIGRASVLAISDGQDVDMMTGWNVGSDGALRAAFDRSDIDFTRSELWTFSSSADGKKFSKPHALDAAKAALVASPSFAGGKLYFATGSSLRATPALYRWAVEDAKAEATELPRLVGVDTMLSWPKFRSLADGSVVVSFRDGKSVPRFALSEDGTKFAPSVAVAGDEEQGAMPDVAEMQDGTLAFSFQQQSASESMISYVVLSHDRGATWSERIRVSESPNVHDTSFVARADGQGLDLYYIHPAGTHGFSLFRRSLGSHGGLGAEERVTSADVGEPSKPSVVRRTDGRLVAAWSEIAERSTTDFTPAIQRVVLAEIANDATR